MRGLAAGGHSGRKRDAHERTRCQTNPVSQGGNRIEDGAYELRGTEHQLPLNEIASRNAIHGLVRWVSWTIAEREELRHSVPKLALEAPVPGGGTVRELSEEVLEIATSGLRERAEFNPAGDNEGGFLDPLRDVVASGKTFAEKMLDRYHGEWQGDVSHVYEEFSF